MMIMLIVDVVLILLARRSVVASTILQDRRGDDQVCDVRVPRARPDSVM